MVVTVPKLLGIVTAVTSNKPFSVFHSVGETFEKVSEPSKTSKPDAPAKASTAPAKNIPMNVNVIMIEVCFFFWIIR